MKIKEIKNFKITWASVISCVEAIHYNLGLFFLDFMALWSLRRTVSKFKLPSNYFLTYWNIHVIPLHTRKKKVPRQPVKKRNQGWYDFLGQKFWQATKKWTANKAKLPNRRLDLAIWQSGLGKQVKWNSWITMWTLQFAKVD